MGIVSDTLEIILKNRKEIFSYTNKIRHYVNHGKHNILILGTGGAGKSTLGKLLGGEYDQLLAGKPYEQSIERENYSYKGKVFGSVIVGPGQTDKRKRIWPDLIKKIESGGINGIIYVVAAGYNSSTEVEPEEHPLFRKLKNASISRFMTVFKKDNMNEEIKILKEELMEALVMAPRPIWFLTVIMKQDLWWRQKTAVLDWYRKGAYNSVIREIIKARRGDRKFAYEVIPVSLVIENLFSPSHKTLLAETASGYDTVKQVESVKHLTRVISELAGAG
jgi:hypothetical protein